MAAPEELGASIKEKEITAQHFFSFPFIKFDKI